MWALITAAAFLIPLIRYAYERVTREREMLAEIRRRVRGRTSPEEMQEHIVALNRIMVRRMVLVLILFLPLIYALSSLGEIDTPLGKMSAVWWFLVSSVVAGLVWGGAEAWILRRGASKR